MAVEVGLVVGVIPHTTPTRSAISVIPVTSSSLIIPTVFKLGRKNYICLIRDLDHIILFYLEGWSVK